MTRAKISGIAPFFIVRNVPAALSFYRDRLGFDITFQGPEPGDIFFGIVQRAAAMIMLTSVGVDPVPHTMRHIAQQDPMKAAELLAQMPSSRSKAMRNQPIPLSKKPQRTFGKRSNIVLTTMPTKLTVTPNG